MITTIDLHNTFILSHNYHLRLVRTFNIYSHNNFQVYNTVLFAKKPWCILDPKTC